MDNPRERIVTLLKEKTGWTDDYAKDAEIGIYNWSIEYCDTKKIFKSWKNSRFTMIYLEKARSILSNLDKESYIGNLELSNKVKDHEILPHELAFMKPDMMFPERWKETTEAFFKKFEHAYENKLEAMSEEYLCLKCKKRKVVYHETFSRSADEPAVIHIQCLNCGNRWKIG